MKRIPLGDVQAYDAGRASRWCQRAGRFQPKIMQGSQTKVIQLRAVLFMSIGMNVLLLAVALRLGRPVEPEPATPADSSPETSVAANAAIRRARSSARTIPVAASATSSGSFEWSRLESADLRAYAANLRAVGCPEKTVRDILLPHVDRVFASRSEQSMIPEDGEFWVNGTRLQAVRWQQEAARRQLEREQVALVKELLGAYLDAKSVREWHREMTAGAILGFLSEGRPEQLISTLKVLADEARAIRDEARGVLTPEDMEQLRGFYARARQEAAAFMGSAEIEELELRITAALVAITFQERLIGLNASGYQVRTIVRGLRPMFEQLLPQFLADQGRKMPDKERFLPDLEAQIRNVLGHPQYERWQRMEDPTFRELMLASEALQIPETRILQVYDLQKACREEEERLRKDASLTAEQREQMLRATGKTFMESARAVLGDEGFQKLKDLKH